MSKIEILICLILLVSTILLAVSVAKKKEHFSQEQLIVCNSCNRFGCQGPRQCQPANTYFTNLYDLMMSRLKMIPEDYQMDLLVQDYRDYNMLMDKLEDLNDKAQGILEFLAAKKAQKNAIISNKKVEIKQEAKKDETKKVESKKDETKKEKFEYGGRVIEIPSIYNGQITLGLPPYISGKNK